MQPRMGMPGMQPGMGMPMPMPMNNMMGGMMPIGGVRGAMGMMP